MILKECRCDICNDNVLNCTKMYDFLKIFHKYCIRQINFPIITLFISTACKTGSYGVNCNATCGHCRNTQECFHIDGSCLTGCEAGYNGSMCKSGMFRD